MADIQDRITVAMITRNEEQAVAKVVHDIRSVVPRAEILIVDSSTDGTAAIAESLGVRVIRQIPPEGYGPAMDLVLRSGRREVVVTLDCDDTYPVDYITTLAEAVLFDGYDIVDGSRLEQRPAAMPLMNYIGNIGFAAMASLLFWRRITDLHSGMRAYRQSIFDGLHYNPRGAALPVELLLRPIKLGLKVKSIGIPYRERIGATTMRPLESALWTARRILASRFK